MRGVLRFRGWLRGATWIVACLALLLTSVALPPRVSPAKLVFQPHHLVCKCSSCKGPSQCCCGSKAFDGYVAACDLDAAPHLQALRRVDLPRVVRLWLPTETRWEPSEVPSLDQPAWSPPTPDPATPPPQPV
jgi:hypothetical protein